MSRMSEKEFTETIKKESPVPCDFKVGDTVTFTNEFGVSFEGRKIIGFADDDSFYGRFIFLDKDSYWFPCKPSELKLNN